MLAEAVPREELTSHAAAPLTILPLPLIAALTLRLYRSISKETTIEIIFIGIRTDLQSPKNDDGQ